MSKVDSDWDYQDAMRRRVNDVVDCYDDPIQLGRVLLDEENWGF